MSIGTTLRSPSGIRMTMAVGLCLLGSGARASISFTETGRTFVETCRSEASPSGYCAGYIAGVADLANLFYSHTADERLHLCLSDEETLKVSKKILSYMTSRSNWKSTVASGQVFNALKTIYPCK